MKKIFGAFCLFMGVLYCLCSCTDTSSEKLLYPNKTSVGSTHGVIYENTVFFFDRTTRSIKYQNIEAITETGRPLINDPLLENEFNPFVDMSIGVYMLIDHEATAQNNNFPVLIVAYKDFTDIKNPHYSIVSFNSKNNKITVIKDDIYDNIQTLHLHNNVVYYTLNRGNDGYDMCKVYKNGKNFSKKENPEKLLYRIHTIYNDKIYYSLDGLDKVYSCNLDFSEDTFLVDAVLKSDFFIHNDYFYYYSNLVQGSLDTFPVYSADLMRFPLSSPSSREVVLEKLSVGLNFESKFYYYRSSPRLIGNGRYDDGTNVLNVLDLDTGESSVFYDLGDNNSTTYYEILSDTWIYFRSTDYSKKSDDSYSSTSITDYYVINVNTKEQIIIPL